MNRQKLAAAWAAVAAPRSADWPKLLNRITTSEDPALRPDKGHEIWVALSRVRNLPPAVTRAPDRALALLSRIRRGPLGDLGTDQLLHTTRDRLIEGCLAGQPLDGWLFIATALAQYCDLTGHLWPEPERLDELPDDLQGDLMMLCAVPLSQMSPERVARFAADEDPFTAPLRARLIEQPAREAQIAAELPVLSEIAPDHQEIAALYEERPYPRAWQVPPIRTIGLRSYVLSYNARLADELPAYPERPRILVAGCGTGRQPISLALALTDCDVLGIDLSRASLAHAVRRAAAGNITNLRFAQADITQLSAEAVNGGDFDHVECAGVLHHLRDPAQGWRAVASMARPGGTLRLAVYSELGRSDVVAARELAASLGIHSHGLEDLRALRAGLEALPETHPARGVLRRVDAYTASGLADLVLNPCEHRYDAAGLQVALADAGLEFLGMEFSNAHRYGQILHDWRARWPADPRMLDLANWQVWEQEHPTTFTNMYLFWARRPA